MKLGIDQGTPLSGAVLVDKPSGPTSHDVVSFVRRILKTKRVGHTGTLDPLATGLLVMLVGHATRLAQFLVADEKEYIADVRLGVSTPTYDAVSLEKATGSTSNDRQLTPYHGGRMAEVTLARVRAVLPDFIGTFPQLPPPYSAKKIDGVRAYEKARRNEVVDLKPSVVTVRELELLPGPSPTADLYAATSSLRLRVAASAGFYVRSLAHDIGQVLGCGGHLEALRRTRVGRFRIEDAATLDQLEAAGAAAEARIVSMNTLLADYPAVSLTAEGLRRVANGNTLGPSLFQPGAGSTGAPLELRAGDRVRVLDASGELLSVAEQRADGLLHPLLVLR